MTDTAETVQEAFDRRAAEHRRLVDTPLPDGWLEACMDAGFPGLPGGMSLEEAERRIRAIVNVVLPLHERMIRERVAKEVLGGRSSNADPLIEKSPEARPVVGRSEGLTVAEFAAGIPQFMAGFGLQLPAEHPLARRETS